MRLFTPARSAVADHGNGCVGLMAGVRRLERKTIDVPVLFIQATNDAALRTLFP